MEMFPGGTEISEDRPMKGSIAVAFGPPMQAGTMVDSGMRPISPAPAAVARILEQGHFFTDLTAETIPSAQSPSGRRPRPSLPVVF